MTIEQTNVRILENGYRQWRDSRGADPTCWLNIMADVFRISSAAGGNNRPGYFRPAVTHGEMRDYLAGIHREWRMELFDVLETIAQDNRVVVRIACTWTNRRTRKSFSAEKLDYFRMENGRIAEFFECFDTAAMEEARRGESFEISL